MAKKIFKGIGKVAKFAVGGILGSKILGGKKKAAPAATPAADGKGPIISQLDPNDPRLAKTRALARPGLGTSTILGGSNYLSDRLGG